MLAQPQLCYKVCMTPRPPSPPSPSTYVRGRLPFDALTSAPPGVIPILLLGPHFALFAPFAILLHTTGGDNNNVLHCFLANLIL